MTADDIIAALQALPAEQRPESAANPERLSAIAARVREQA